MNSASIREYFVRQEHLFESRDQRTKTGWSRKNFRTWNRTGLGPRKIFQYRTAVYRIPEQNHQNFENLRPIGRYVDPCLRE